MALVNILDDALAQEIHQRLTNNGSSDESPITAMFRQPSAAEGGYFAALKNSPMVTLTNGAINMFSRGYGENSKKSSTKQADQPVVDNPQPVQPVATPDYSDLYRGALAINAPDYSGSFVEPTFGYQEPVDNTNYAPFSPAVPVTAGPQTSFGNGPQPAAQQSASTNTSTPAGAVSTSRNDGVVVDNALDYPWGNPNPNWEQDQINQKAIAREKSSLLKWKESHGVTEDGLPYQILSDGRKIAYNPNTPTGKAILKKLATIPTADMLAISPLEEAAANHNYAGAQQYETALKEAGKVPQNQINTNNSQQAYSSAGNTYSNSSNISQKPKTFEERLASYNAQEIRALQDTYSHIKESGYAETYDFDNMANSLISIKNNMFQQLEKNTSVFGGVKDAEYALGSNVTNTSDIAQRIIDDMGYAPEYKGQLSKTITDLKKEYPNVPLAAIGMVLKQNLTQNPEVFTFETKIADGLEYQDNNLKIALSTLNDKTHQSSYERLKDEYMDCANFMNRLKKSATQLQLAEQAQATYIEDSTNWGDSTNELHVKWLKEDRENITKYTAGTLKELLGSAEKVGSYYDMEDRVPNMKNDPAKKSSDSENK